MNEISDTLLNQRLRNRIIEVLEMFADEAFVEKFGTDEIIESWYDFVDEDRFEYINEPVFTKNEINSIKRFLNLLESSFESVPTTWTISELDNNKPWNNLVSAAKEELEIFMERGRLDEEKEIT